MLLLLILRWNENSPINPMDNNGLLFSEDTSTAKAESSAHHQKRPWLILVVDDEQEIHNVTRLVLKSVQFDGRPLQFLNAYSAQEAKDILQQEQDIALAIIDVVMETDDAGLTLVNWIRKELTNDKIRLVLRTGQPGQAPEQQVIENYDINDYKDKTDLTQVKMKTLVYAALRSYRDIVTIDRSKQGLERVIKATSTIYQNYSMESFASAILDQINRLLNYEYDSIYASAIRAMAASHKPNSSHFEVVATTGNIATQIDSSPNKAIPPDIIDGFNQALLAKQSLYLDDRFFGYFITNRGHEHLLYVSPGNKLTETELHLLKLYSNSVAIALESRNLHNEVEETQRELIFRLSGAMERHSAETGAHVKRVAEIAELLALKYGLGEEFAAQIKLASPLHDIGKIGIPDNILKKPGPLDPLEWEQMKTHSDIGYQLLGNSDKALINLAAIIACQHHENWDGSGYPKGLKGYDIHVAGRITALADVFDALGSKRCYKAPWDAQSILDEIQLLSGTKFEPGLVELLMLHHKELLAIREKFPD